MQFIYFTFCYYNCIKLSYIDLEVAWREESKELFLFQQNTFFRFRSFHFKTPLSRYVSAFLSRMKVLFSLDLGSSFATYLMSLFPSLYYDVPSLFLALVPFSILCYFATLPITFSGVSLPFSWTLLSCHPLRMSPLVRPQSSRCCLTSIL